MRHYLFALFLFSCSISMNAQYFDVGLSVGASNYSGEFTSNGFKASGYHTAMGIFGRYNYSSRLAFRSMLTLGQLSGSDANSGKAQTLVRNLDFKTHIYELAALAEFNITPFAIRNNQGSAIYLAAGVAGFHFNPKSLFNGRWVDLHPLGTEGQYINGGKSYSLTQLSIPVGGGVKWALSNRINFNAEVLLRKTFTDHIDDIGGAYPDLEALYAENPMAAMMSFRSPQYLQKSLDNPVGKQRGNNNVKDYYMTVMLSLSFNLTHKQGLDFDKKFEIFKSPPEELSYVQPWVELPRT